MSSQIMIIGAGPVGQLLAIHLKQFGISTTLVGPIPKPLKNMVFALHPSHYNWLHLLGISPSSKAVDAMHLQTDYGEYTLQASEVKRNALCHIVKHTDLLYHISKKRREMDIPWLQTTPESYSGNTLIIDNISYSPQKIIACDGTHSWLRKHTPILVDHYDYQQYAHTAILTHPHKITAAHQKFDSSGTVAILPMENPHQSALIWSCDLSAHQKILTDGLKPRLCQSPLMTRITSVQHHQYIPLSASLAQRYNHDNIFLLGNALHTIHPLAGVGFNLAISDLKLLTEIIIHKKPHSHFQLKRKRAHLKAHWLTKAIATSRHNDALYTATAPILNKLIPLHHIQKEIIYQMDKICGD